MVGSSCTPSSIPGLYPLCASSTLSLRLIKKNVVSPENVPSVGKMKNASAGVPSRGVKGELWKPKAP